MTKLIAIPLAVLAATAFAAPAQAGVLTCTDRFLAGEFGAGTYLNCNFDDTGVCLIFYDVDRDPPGQTVTFVNCVV